MVRSAVFLLALVGCAHAQPAEVEPIERDPDVMRARAEDPRSLAQREEGLYVEAPFLLVELAEAAVRAGDFEAAADYLRRHRAIAGADGWRERAPYSIAIACARGKDEAARELAERYVRAERGIDEREPPPAEDDEDAASTEPDPNAPRTIDPFAQPETLSPFRSLPPMTLLDHPGLADCAAMIDEVYAELDRR